MNDRALQHHCTRADGVISAVVIEGKHARCDQHELVTARWKVKMEIGGARIGTVNRQICRNLVEQEGFVVRTKAFVRTVIERLRAISRLVRSIPVAIDGHEILAVLVKRIAVRVGQAKPFGIDRGDRPPPNLSAAAMAGSQLHGTMRKSRQLRCSAAISTAAAANAPKLLA